MSNVLKVNLQETIHSLRDRGWWRRRIARELGIDRETVSRYLRLAKPAILTTGSEDSGEAKPAISTAVHDVLEHRIKRSGLELPQCGSHVLRHSFALNLLRQGIGMKTIGDALGHRDIESTFVYLRLDLDDLREVAQPAPAPIPASPAPPLASTCV